LDPRHMIAKAADAVMILAMHIIRHCSAHRHEGGSGRGRRDEAPRQEYVQEITERDPRFQHSLSAFRIKGENPVEPFREDHRAVAVEALIAIAASRAPCEQRSSCR